MLNYDVKGWRGGHWRVEVLASLPDFSVDSLDGVGSGCWAEGDTRRRHLGCCPSLLSSQMPRTQTSRSQ